jgi:hypothetical protein
MAFTHTISQDYSLPVQEEDGASLVGPNILSRPEANSTSFFVHFISHQSQNFLTCFALEKAKC